MMMMMMMMMMMLLPPPPASVPVADGLSDDDVDYHPKEK